MDLAIAGVAHAEANWGQWKARCPRRDCTNAMPLEPGQVEFLCVGGPDGCGWATVVIWPPDPQAIEALLAMRPIRRTQNWVPGEALEDLLAENAEHGCLPSAWQALADVTGERLILLATRDGRAVGGLLHQQLEAAGRRQIGA